MLDEEVAGRVERIIAEALRCPPQKVHAQARFVQDLEADSLGIVETIFAIEKEFDLRIPDDEVEKLHTVGDAIRYISSRVK